MIGKIRYSSEGNRKLASSQQSHNNPQSSIKQIQSPSNFKQKKLAAKSRRRINKTEQQDQKKPSNLLVSQLENENCVLRTKLLDFGMKQREYMNKIMELEKMCLKLRSKVERDKEKVKSKQEEVFLNAMKSTFQSCFGISDYRQIWKKEKVILEEWMDQRIRRSKAVMEIK